jgi:biopolymer transport protein ExbD/biopolymer transport protein TolR
MAKGKKRPGSNVTSDINVTPMVDVMLVLLIIFMVITPMLQKGKDVDMSKVDSPTQMPDADKDDALLVAVTKDGTVYFGNDKLTNATALTEKVRDKLSSAKATEKRVYIKADYRAKYGQVVEVVDNVRSAGVDQVGLMTDQRKTTATPPPAGGLQ